MTRFDRCGVRTMPSAGLFIRRSVALVCFLLMTGSSLWAQNMDRQAAKDSLAAAVARLAFHPDSVELLLQKAAWNVELEQWEYARDTYTKVLAHNPNQAEALFYRAYVNQKLRLMAFARADYESVLRLQPGHFRAQVGLALLYQDEHKLNEALDRMNVVVENFPDSAVVWALRAGMEVENAQWEAAAYDYTKALHLSKDHKDYLLSRADVYLKMGKYDAAKADLDRLVQVGVARASLQDRYRRVARAAGK